MDKNLDTAIFGEIRVLFHPTKDEVPKFREFNVKGFCQGQGYIEAVHKAMGTFADPLSKTGIIYVFKSDAKEPNMTGDPVMIGTTCINRKYAVGIIQVAIPMKVCLREANFKRIVQFAWEFSKMMENSREWLERDQREKDEAERKARAMLGT